MGANAGLGHWNPLTPVEAQELFEPFDGPWWIAGGWAIELFAGVPIRPHDDIDIEIPRSHARKLATAMSGWDLQLASDGRLTPWDPALPVPGNVSSVWCRPKPEPAWRIQIMFATVRDGVWHFRRDERVSRPLDEVFSFTETGLPILAPEIQLLYKASGTREKDEIDFRAAVKLMDAEHRAWLVEALTLVYPDSQWLRVLADRDTNPYTVSP